MNWLGFIFSGLQSAAQQTAMHGPKHVPAAKRLRNSRILAWTGVVILLAGLGAVAWGVWEIASGLASASWPTVPGLITWSDGMTGPDPYTETKQTVIRYEYVVDGRIFTGTRVSFGIGGPPERLATRYPLGARVTVYHKPGDPSTAALEVGMDSGDCTRMAVLAGLPGLAGLFVLWISAGMRKDALLELGRLKPKPRERTIEELEEDNPYRRPVDFTARE